MRTFADSTLNTLDRLCSNFGPLSSLISGIAEHIAPTVTAQACGGLPCHAGCKSTRCGHLYAYVTSYASTVDDCIAHNYNCQTVKCIC